MDTKELEKIEIDLLLDGIQKRYGYDFRDYASASMYRRLQHNLLISKTKSFTALLDKILHDQDAFESLLSDLSITVTEMFRDPEIYKAMREHIMPILKTYPYFKIWHAGCATGEEVYSMAIMLHEEGILEKAHIYATDINTHALEIAKEGIYSTEKMQLYTELYNRTGGKNSLSDYYHAKYGSIQMADFLKQRITFAYHNLAVDHSFCEAQVVICRNVLIYFNRHLQNKVFKLLDDSLCYGGFMFLGSKETIDFSDIKPAYETVLIKEKLYRKKYPNKKAKHK